MAAGTARGGAVPPSPPGLRGPLISSHLSPAPVLSETPLFPGVPAAPPERALSRCHGDPQGRARAPSTHRGQWWCDG